MKELEKMVKRKVLGKCLRKNVDCSPQKARIVAKYIKGMNVSIAMNKLSLLDKKVAVDFLKCLKSAKAQVEEKYKSVSGENLYISTVIVSDGIKGRRPNYGAKGRMSMMIRRHSNLYVTLSEKVNGK